LIIGHDPGGHDRSAYDPWRWDECAVIIYESVFGNTHQAGRLPHGLIPLTAKSGPFGPGHSAFSAVQWRAEGSSAMSFTGVSHLDLSIDKTNIWLADVGREFGTRDRRFAYRVTRAWLHTLRDRLPVPVAAHFAAQLPELLRGVFYDGWNPSRVPVRYGPAEYAHRFARDAGIQASEVADAASRVTAAARRHVSGGVLDEALGAIPPALRQLAEPAQSRRPSPGQPLSGSRTA
jgi:uncharacterized protein (DUF2267 family)